jgi:aspartate racemase
MTEQNAIGVVGGLGPYAGSDLVTKIFDETRATSDQEHLPVALISFPAHVPDRSAYIADQSAPNPVLPLVEILRRLEQAGCSVAGMPCNTAHSPIIFEDILERLGRLGGSIHLLNMIEATAASVAEYAPDAKRIGIIATTATIECGLYADALGAVGLGAVNPDSNYQDDIVNPVIFDSEWGLKAMSNPPSAEARRRLLDAVEHLRDRGADAVILGCTELPLAVPENRIRDMPIIDSTRSLARALIRASHPERLRRR